MFDGRLSSNLLTANEDINFNLDDIHVPLALVERRQRDKRPGDTPAETGSQLYEPTGYEEKQRFEHQQFLDNILGKGEGKTKGRQIAIIGEPGAGKTTQLQKIADWILEKGPDLPIWISLADLQGRELGDYLLETWLKKAIPLSRLSEQVREDFLAQLEQGRVWLLLDGVDEMATERATAGLPLQQIATQLKGWIASARVVLTCRVNVWEANLNALEAFETYRMLNFNYPTQVEAFIGKWFEHSDAANGEALRQELAKAEYQRLQDLVKNPLRLTLLCSTWQTSEGLPETQAALYKRFVGQIYRWKQNHFPTTEQQRQQLNHALGELARQGIDDATSPFRLRHQLVAEVLGDCDDDKSLFALALQLGWLNQVGVAAEDPDEKVYAFYHATFQEYFAALSIEDWDFFLPREHRECPVPGKRYRIFDSLWKQTILLWLGRKDVQKDKKEEFIVRLIELKDGCGNFYEYRAYFLAAAGIAEFKECDRADEIIEKICQYAFILNIEPDDLREFLTPEAQGARDALQETVRHKVISTLAKLLGDKRSNKYRLWLVAAKLATIDPGNQSGSDALVQIIKNSTDGFTVIIAADALLKIDPGNLEATAGLEKLITKSGDEDISKQAKYILENSDLGHIALSKDAVSSREKPEVLEAVLIVTHNYIENITILEFSIYEDSRWQAADRLAEIARANPDAIAELERILKTYTDNLTLMIAAYALGSIYPGNATALEVLLKILQTCADENCHWQAADSLKKILTTEGKMLHVVNILQNDLYHSTSKQDLKRFFDYYEVIWHCAQNLPYPEFYRAWHDGEDEGELENLTELPDRLSAKQEEMGLSSSLQLICIDGSKFIDRDNPAAKIYNEMRRDRCPKSADGTPKTMADLQSYWDELTLESEQAIALVFYNPLTTPELSGFSERFLQDLSRVDGAIAVVTEVRVSGLQTFSPSQGNWVADMVNWIKGRI